MATMQCKRINCVHSKSSTIDYAVLEPFMATWAHKSNLPSVPMLPSP